MLTSRRTFRMYSCGGTSKSRNSCRYVDSRHTHIQIHLHSTNESTHIQIDSDMATNTMQLMCSTTHKYTTECCCCCCCRLVGAAAAAVTVAMSNKYNIEKQSSEFWITTTHHQRHTEYVLVLSICCWWIDWNSDTIDRSHMIWNGMWLAE